MEKQDQELHNKYRQLWIQLNRLTSDICGQFCYTLGKVISNY